MDNSASGSRDKRCFECARASRLTKETIHNGLRIVRVRYGLPYSELPDCEVLDLNRFLSFLLQQGKVRDSVEFPRRQKRDSDGLCRLQRLRRHERWELAHSCASIKRNLPAGCSRCKPSRQEGWITSACSQTPPPISDEYIDFVRKKCTQLFAPGWDRRYDSFVGNHLPNPTSRKPRLSRADQLWAGRRSEFLYLTSHESDLAPRLEARYKEVLSAGKVRPLLIYDENIDLLGPMHKMIYDHLTRQEWLLCGPPTEKRITSVCVNEYQTSVDLVAATDGLSHRVCDAILDSAFFTSVKIPRSLRSFAKASYRPYFKVGGVEYRVSHGQMQGAYLSFPLLCIQSWLAASWAARDCVGTRILVNGDDTVISATRVITVQDYPPGFRLNDDKTIRGVNVVEVNSTVFLRRNGRWREVRHLRRGGAVTDFAGLMHLTTAVLKGGPVWVDAFWRSRIGRHWGLLPSQVGHRTYVAFCRERQLMRYRHPTALPQPRTVEEDERLRRIVGRDATPVECEALRSFLWGNGRLGGLKRDVYNPSCGCVRRTYRYRSNPPFSYLGYVYPSARKRLEDRQRRPAPFFWLPVDFDTDEEREAQDALDAYVRACSLVS